MLVCLLYPHPTRWFSNVWRGQSGDGRVWNGSDLKRTLDNEEFPVDADGAAVYFEVPHGDGTLKVPIYVAADPAFAQSSRVVKGYPGQHLTDRQLVFNKVQSKARQVRPAWSVSVSVG